MAERLGRRLQSALHRFDPCIGLLVGGAYVRSIHDNGPRIFAPYAAARSGSFFYWLGSRSFKPQDGGRNPEELPGPVV